MADYQTVDADLLRSCAETILAGHGVSGQDAATVVDNLIDADLRGVHSHGVWRVPEYVDSLKAGTYVARPEIKVVRDEGGQLVMDGGLGLGQIACTVAIKETIKRAHEYGIAAVAVRNNGHCGTLAYWAQQAADAGCIGITLCNAGIHMAPTGGREKAVGNNPLAIGAPTDLGWSLMLDMAMSGVAAGKVRLAKTRGDRLPEGWAMDKEGNPTTDPNLAHALLPIAGPKGYGLAVLMDVLSGVLSGGRFGNMVGGLLQSQFFMAIEIERFIPMPEYLARVRELIEQLHSVPLAPGYERIFLAGEREHELLVKRQKEGIPTDVPTLKSLERLSAEVGKEYSLTA